MEYYSNADYLKHYGVIGMRWGVRRYQNADGSLTDIGKRHYANGIAKGFYKAAKVERKRMKAETYKEGMKLEKKQRNIEKRVRRDEGKAKARGMTTADLNAGRYRVARGRAIRRTMAFVATAGATAVSATVIASGGLMALPVTALTGVATAKIAPAAWYYQSERRAYKPQE